MKLTINDIAAMCGVSKGTVNRAIHNKPGINPATRKRIMETIEKHQFRQNYFATSLATGVTNQVAVVVPGVMNELFSMLYTHVAEACWERGLYPALSLSSNNPVKEAEYLQSFLDRGVDGILIFPVSRNPEPMQKILQAKVPMVFVLNEVQGVDTSVVRIDDYKGMYASTKSLIASGHRRILYLDGARYTEDYNNSINVLKYKGHIDALREHGITPDPRLYASIDRLNYDVTGMNLLSSILAAGEGLPSAIMCFHDRIAMWACRMAQNLGYSVPGDMSVMGFDNINDLHWFTPALTTTAVPIQQIARESIDILEQSIRTKENLHRRVVLDTKMIPGRSVKSV